MPDISLITVFVFAASVFFSGLSGSCDLNLIIPYCKVSHVCLHLNPLQIRLLTQTTTLPKTNRVRP